MISLRQAMPRRAVLALLAAILPGVALVFAERGPQGTAGEPPLRFELRPGDHICIIGNTLADRMQHDGWLETMLQRRFPRHELVVRDLGFSGDELTLRLRSMDFGTPDQWLAGAAPVPQPNKLTHPDAVPANRFARTNTRADVVFAFFGYNESFADGAGLAQFKKDLDGFIQHALAQKYNGKSAPRLVLFSPIAHEERLDRNLPDGGANNRRLALYTQAMAEVARSNKVFFVDLFAPTRTLEEAAAAPLTINGVHLNEHGNRLVAEIIDKALFADAPAARHDEKALAKLNQAVRDKNDCWFRRYRTVDGYSTYGDRAFLKFTDGQSNYEVVQRELEMLDVMTANRDRRIWAVAQGGDLMIDDSNTPAAISVKTNKPGALPGGKHVFLDGEAAIKQMTVAKGMKVNLFASEQDFPELAKPVQMAFDAQGRLWVAVWPTYPHRMPKEERNDKLLIFEDTKGAGKADKCTVFADHLHCPTGFEFYNGGVLVAQAPDLLFLKDTKGTGKADLRRRVLSGLDSADTHHTANSFTLDPGGALYFQEGTFHHTQVETPYGPPQRCANAGVYRYEPRTQKFEVYVTYPFANPHGHVWDRWGQDFVYDGTGANPYHGALFSGHLDYPRKHATPPQVYQQRTRPCPGVEILSSRHFPEANQGNLLVANVIGFQGILQYKVKDKGASFTATEVEPILSSTDPNFRPSDLKIGPDGAIYFLDWLNPIIGHMQHNLRDPNRDRTHGRIYRVTYQGRPLLKAPKITGEPIGKLLDVLKAPEDRVRYRVRIELGGRDSDQVIAAVKQWIAGLDPKNPEHEHHLLEALWVHQAHNVVNVELLHRLLDSTDFRAQAAATRVLCVWRDRVPNALELLKRLARAPYPRVRLEAVRAASFFPVAKAVEVPLSTIGYPSDIYLDFVRGETMKALEPYWKKALAEGRAIALFTPAGTRFFLESLSTDNLLKMKRSRDVYRELLLRPGVRDEYRKEGLAGLAKLENKAETQVLLDAITEEDKTSGQRSAVRGQRGTQESVVFDLVRLLTSRPAEELVGVRGELERLATRAKRPVTRQLGFVALVAADGGGERAWELAAKSEAVLEDLVRAMPLVRDPSQRASLYPKVAPLLQEQANAGPALRHAAMNALPSVRGKEEETFKALAPFIHVAADRHAAVQAIQRIPAIYWPKDAARPMLDVLLAYVRQVPARRRTAPEVVDALQLADALAALLPRDEARQMRRELGELGVRILRLATVPDQMLFDKERLVVAAGKPVEVVFENNDLMPHNFVLARPGALEEIGLLAEATATQAGAAERQYIPPSDKILVASRLLSPRDAQKLDFTAPARPGVYPYVCTYPGHWRRMYGALYVVADLDEYLADAEGYLARHPLPVADDLLKLNRPRTEWKYDDLASAVEQLDTGRSFGNAKQLFQAANCIACHKVNDAGTELGPDLTKLDPKWKPVDILRDILEPSFRINEKYYTYIFETDAGKIVTGLILEETPDVVKVIENPLLKSQPVVLQRAQIAERKKSLTSIMPKGLLDRLTREEVLDLVAYVIARGDPHHPLFQGAHNHGHAANGH